MSDHAAVIHAAADALVDHAVDVFWRTDSAFASSSRHDYKAAAAWLHQHAAGVAEDTNPDNLVHLFAPHDDTIACCRETDVIQTTVTLEAVTCGWCRVDAHINAKKAASR